MELRAALPDISETTIRGAGIPIAHPWCGVRQHTLDQLESSLRELSEIYEKHPHVRRACREQVSAAKARARFLSRKNPLKVEMVECMLVWMRDPAMFPAVSGAAPGNNSVIETAPSRSRLSKYRVNRLLARQDLARRWNFRRYAIVVTGGCRHLLQAHDHQGLVVMR